MVKNILRLLTILIAAGVLAYTHHYFYSNYVILNKTYTDMLLQHTNDIIEEEDDIINELIKTRTSIGGNFNNKVDQIIYDAAVKRRLEASNLKHAIIGNISSGYYKYEEFHKNFEDLPKINVIQETVLFQYYIYVILILLLILLFVKKA